MIRIFDKNTISGLNWAEYNDGAKLQTLLEPLVLNGAQHYIFNAKQEAAVLAADGYLYPLIINNGKKTSGQSYVVSTLSQYFSYSLEEIRTGEKFNNKTKKIAEALFPLARIVAKYLGFEKVVFINNWLFSGNLYPDNANKTKWNEVIDVLKQHYKNYAFVFRSVDTKGTQGLFAELQKAHCKALSARLLYYLDFTETDLKKKRPYQQDLKRWQKQEDYTERKIDHLDDKTLDDIIRLYEDLYIEKHSKFNPKYTKAFIIHLFKSKMLTFSGIYEKENLVAIQLIWQRGSIITTPFIGYDQNITREKSPYRYLNVVLTEKAKASGHLLNMSSGADQYKMQRGGKPVFEYNMVYFAHLPVARTLIWKIMVWLGLRYIQPKMMEQFA